MIVTKCNIDIQEIIQIAKEAGDIAMDFYDREYSIEQKQNKTPVTQADIAINDFLLEKLSRYNYPILSEETKDDFAKRQVADFVWIVDPLDGTSDFIQKTGEFSIMIGLVNKNGEVVLGVVYAPALDELYYAQKNKGAYLCHPGLDLESQQQIEASKSVISTEAKRSGEISKPKEQKISVSNKNIKNGKILVSRNHLGEYEQEIAKKNQMKQIPAGSAGLKICWIARGDAELYINSSNKSGLWDICAADAILSEAGGGIYDKNCNQIFYNLEETMLLNGYMVLGCDLSCNKIIAHV